MCGKLSHMARKLTLQGGVLAVVILVGIASTGCGRRSPVARIVAVPEAVESVQVAEPAGPPIKETKAEPEDEPEEALRFFVAQRAPDGVNLPVERLLAAKEHVKRMRRFSIAQGRHAASMSSASSSSYGATSKYNSTATSGQSGTPGTWTSVGPANVGGLTRAFVVNPLNPDIMYAGASGGGVWKTVDGGKTWAPLADFLPTISVQSLTMDPANPDILYAGTGDNIGGEVGIRGQGIFQSTDGGQSWNQLPFTADANFFYVYSLVVSPNDSNRIYAGTVTGVWMSVDRGVSWTQTLPRIAPNSGCEELVIRTDQSTDYLFAACGRFNAPKTAVFRNVDAANGAAWENVFAIDGMGRTSLALAPSNQGIMYALVADVTPGSLSSGGMLGVFRSDTNGDAGSWQAKATNSDDNRVNVTLLSNPRSAFLDVCSTGKATFTGQGSHDNVLAVDPLNPDRVWAGGIDTFRSDDGGANWGIAMFWEAAAGIAAHADNHRLVFHPKYDGDKNQILFNTSDGGVYMTSNANSDVATGTRAGCSPYTTKVAWKSLNSGYTVTQFYDGAVFPGANMYIAGSQDNGTLWGSDATGAASWITARGGDGGFVLVNPKDPNEQYTNYVNLSLDRSVDGGTTLTPITAGITEASSNFLFIAPVAMDPSEPKRIYVGGRALWQTNDRGDTWLQATPIGPASQGSISAIAVSPLDSRVVMYGTNGGEVFHTNQALSTDGSSAWDFARPRLSGFVARIAFDPTDVNTAYAVYRTFKGTGQNYVYKTSDGGATWTSLDGTGDGALPDAPVHSIVIDPLNNQTLYVGTELGVFTSLDGGNSWMSDTNDFANTPITQLILDRSAGATNLIAFTYGRGVWKTAIPGTGTPCQYKVSAPQGAMAATGDDITAEVQAGPGCVWSVSPLTGAFFARSPAVGTGAASARIYGSWNVSTTARTGTFAIGDQTLKLTQKAAVTVSGNDDVAAPVAALPYLGYLDSRRDTTGLTDPVHSCTKSQDYKSVWWTFVAPDSGTAEISLQGRRYDVFGNSGVVLTVYDTTRDASQELSCSVYARNTSTWTSTTARVTVTKGQTYQVEASATGDSAVDGGQTILAIVMK